VNIAVVIPCYNVAALVAGTIESVLAQTLPAAEIIAVNDGSTDDTARVLAKYTPRIRVVNQENGGLGAARNAGALATECEWLAFLDADDLYLPHALAFYNRLHETLPAANVLFGDFQDFEESGRLLPPSASRYLHDIGKLAAVTLDDCFLLARPADVLVLRNGAFTPSCLVIRRSVFLAAGQFDACREFQGAEDLDLYFRLLPTEDVAFLNRLVLRKRVHAANMSHSGQRMRQASERALRRAEALYAQHHPDLLPVLNRKFNRQLASWAHRDLRSSPEAALRTSAALLKRSPWDVRAWWLLARAALHR
jgi:glycosyltransferase involved in cell wall biosynthesis